MTTKKTGGRLGMSRSIPRRDFLQGVAGGVVGLSAAACGGRPGLFRTNRRDTPQDPNPTNDGAGAGADSEAQVGRIVGQEDSASVLGHCARDGAADAFVRNAVDTGEVYDLVVIGTGLAGLAAAWEYKRNSGSDARILLLDACTEFGGHARRNTFTVPGGTLVAPGGCSELTSYESSSSESMDLLESVGVQLDALAEFRDDSFHRRLSVSSGVFYDPKLYGVASDRQWGVGFGDKGYEEFFANAPVSERARQELVTLFTGAQDGDALDSITYEHYLRSVLGLGDDAVRFGNVFSLATAGLGADVVSAGSASAYAPGFGAFKGGAQRGPLKSPSPRYRYPDGLHTVARHFLKALIPDAISGDATPVDIFNGALRQTLFDSSASPVRMRLGSCAVRVEHVKGDKLVEVVYLQDGGTAAKVQCTGVIVAAWGGVARHVVAELEQTQRDALAACRRTAVLCINVLLRNWQPLADIGVFEGFWPGGFFTSFELSDPLWVGTYRPMYHPNQPIVMSILKHLHTPGLSADQQMLKARSDLVTTSFSDIEQGLRGALDTMLGPRGFDAAQDILGITVNRWAHGYPFFFRPDQERSYEAGRVPVGNISFASADAGGDAWAQQAWDHGMRAAHEQLDLA